MSILSWRFVRVFTSLVVGSMAGCATAAPATQPNTQSETRPEPPYSSANTPDHLATTRPAQRVITLDAAVQSEQLERDDWELNMQNQLRFGGGAILFGQLSIYNDDDQAQQTVPVIGFKQGNQMMALRIDDARLKNAGWSYVSSGPAINEFWGVLDASLDDLQPDLLLVHSTDAGKTMHLISLPKPRKACVFDSFCMDRSGHGRVSVYVDRSKTRPNHAGYYHYRTDDDGQTWTATQFEPDAMTPAEDAPDDAPEPAGKPSRV